MIHLSRVSVIVTKSCLLPPASLALQEEIRDLFFSSQIEFLHPNMGMACCGRSTPSHATGQTTTAADAPLKRMENTCTYLAAAV